MVPAFISLLLAPTLLLGLGVLFVITSFGLE